MNFAAPAKNNIKNLQYFFGGHFNKPELSQTFRNNPQGHHLLKNKLIIITLFSDHSSNWPKDKIMTSAI